MKTLTKVLVGFAACSFLGTAAQALTDSGPIVLNGSGSSNRVVSGLRITNPNGDCVVISGGASNIRIEDNEIGPCKGHAVRISNTSNQTVQRNYIHHTGSGGNGVDTYQVTNLNVRENRMEYIGTGLYALESSTVKFDFNRVLNVQGPMPRGQAVQFNKVRGPASQVICNVAENVVGQNHAEDVINMFDSRGTATDPIRVIGNKVRGSSTSPYGGGIMLGDGNGAYIVAQDNILVDPGQYGVAVAGGQNISILNNLVYGRQQSFTNVGIYVWDFYETGTCFNNRVEGNQVKWTNSAGNSNPYWNPGTCGPVAGQSNNQWGAPIDASIWDRTIAACGTSMGDTTAPSVPQNLSASAASASQINLTWTASTDNSGSVTGYRVFRGGSQITTVSGTSLNDTGLSPSTAYTYTVAAYDAAGNPSAQSASRSATTSAMTPPPDGTSYISDLSWLNPVNAWGPIEKDKSNGETGAGDGRTITLNGATYTKGLGVHAASSLDVHLAGKCSSFLSDVGVDDEVTAGSVVFQVFADGTKLFDSGVMTSATATKAVNVPLTGKTTLKLVVTDGGDGGGSDHGDWASARIVCGSIAQGPYPGPSAHAVPGTIEAENFDVGGEGTAYHDTEAANLGNVTTRAEGVDLETASEGSANVSNMGATEWLEYTVNVAQAGIYDLEVRAAVDAGYGGTFHVDFAGVNKTGAMTLAPTGGWQSWATIKKTGISLSAGTQVVRLAIDTAPNGAFGNINWLRLTTPVPVNQPPTVALAAPTHSQSFTAPASVTITANAGDSDGAISKVEFFQGSTKLGEDTSSPYSYTWTGAPAGSHSLTAKATDNAGATTTSAVITITYVVSVGQTPYPGPGAHALPGLLEAENFDQGGEGVAYHDTEATNLGNVTTRTEGVDLETASEGGANVSHLSATEWLEYTVNVAQAGTYDLEVRAAVDAGYGGTFHVDFAGVNKTGAMTLAPTGGWQSWTTIKKTGISLSAGAQVVRLAIDTAPNGAFGNINWLRLTTSVPITPAQGPYPGPSAHAVPGTIEAENFDVGGEGTAYHDTEAANLGNVTTRAEGVDLETASEGGANVSNMGATEWLEYTVNVAQAGTYDFEVRAAAYAGYGGTFHVDFGGVNKTGTMTLAPTGGWQSWTTIKKTGISLSAGTQVVRLAIDTAPNGAFGNINWLRLTGVMSPARMLSLSAASVMPVNGTISATYQGDPVTAFQWTITQYVSGASSRKAASAHDNALQSYTSANKQLSLAPFGLTPGRYTIAVAALYGDGSQSETARAEVTLVAADVNNTYVYPNPWRRDLHPGTPIRFSGLQMGSTLKIFTVSGHLIKSLTVDSHPMPWNRRDDSGNEAASGLYLYLGTGSQGDQQRGKFVIAK